MVEAEEQPRDPDLGEAGMSDLGLNQLGQIGDAELAFAVAGLGAFQFAVAEPIVQL